MPWKDNAEGEHEYRCDLCGANLDFENDPHASSMETIDRLDRRLSIDAVVWCGGCEQYIDMEKWEATKRRSHGVRDIIKWTGDPIWDDALRVMMGWTDELETQMTQEGIKKIVRP